MAGLFSAALAQVKIEKKQQPLRHSAAQLIAAQQWRHGDLTLTCVDKYFETDDTVSLTFQAQTATQFCFKPGQFVTITFDIAGKSYSRCYSISSSPSRPMTLVLTVRKVIGGMVSSYLVDKFTVGDVVKSSLPMGQFNIADIKADKYLLLSAGCGITPMHSIVTFLADTQRSVDVAMIHSAKHRPIIFDKPLTHLAQTLSGFKFSLMLTGTQPDSNSPSDINIRTGRISIAALAELVPDYQSRNILVCGSADYIESVTQLLATAGVDASNIYYENFAPTSAPVAVNPENMLTITAGSQLTQAPEGSLLLDAIEAITPINGACRSGICGACKCKVLSGKVTTTSVETLTDAEIAEGMVLACSCYLQSDISITV